MDAANYIETLSSEQVNTESHTSDVEDECNDINDADEFLDGMTDNNTTVTHSQSQRKRDSPMQKTMVFKPRKSTQSRTEGQMNYPSENSLKTRQESTVYGSKYFMNLPDRKSSTMAQLKRQFTQLIDEGTYCLHNTEILMEDPSFDKYLSNLHNNLRDTVTELEMATKEEHTKFAASGNSKAASSMVDAWATIKTKADNMLSKLHDITKRKAATDDGVHSKHENMQATVEVHKVPDEQNTTHSANCNRTNNEDSIEDKFQQMSQSLCRSLVDSMKEVNDRLREEIQCSVRYENDRVKNDIKSETENLRMEFFTEIQKLREEQTDLQKSTNEMPKESNRHKSNFEQRLRYIANDSTGMQRNYQQSSHQSREAQELYGSLPSPWNCPQDMSDEKNKYYYRVISNMSNLPKFMGHVKNFDRWRTEFIELVHSVGSISVQQKAHALRNAISDNTPRLLDLKNSLRGTFENYKIVICALEKEFGGPDRLVDQALNDIYKLKLLKKNDLETHQTFTLKLKYFLETLKENNNKHDAQSQSFFNLLRRKISDDYLPDYYAWLRLHLLDKSPFTLLQWVEETTDILTEANIERYTVKNNVTLSQRQSRVGDSNNKKQNFAPRLSSLDELGERVLTDISCPPCLTDASEIPEGADDISFELGEDEPEQALALSVIPKGCTICQKPHSIETCKVFAGAHPEKRLELAKDHKLCYSCLLPNHISNECKNKKKCLWCKYNHHMLLHGSRNEHLSHIEEQQNSISWKASEPLQETHSEAYLGLKHNGNYIHDVGIQCIPVVALSPDGKCRVEINALLDSGNSKFSVLSSIAAKKLKLTGRMNSVGTIGIGGMKVPQKTLLSNIIFQSFDGSIKRNMVVEVMDSPVGNFHPASWNDFKQNFDHIKDINFLNPLGDQPVIDMIIGATESDLFCPLKVIHGARNEPIAIKTVLGWTGLGPLVPEALENLQHSKTSTKKDSISLLLCKARNETHCYDNNCLFNAEHIIEQNQKNMVGKLIHDEAYPVDYKFELYDCIKMQERVKTLATESTGLSLPELKTYSIKEPEALPVIINTPTNTTSIKVTHGQSNMADKELNFLVQQQWEIEEVINPDKYVLSVNEQYVVDFIKKNQSYIRKDGIKYYEVSCAWKLGEPSFKNNFSAAFKRLCNMEYGRLKDPLLRDKYDQIIMQWVDKGYAEKVPANEVDKDCCYYLPHFPVVQKKVRPVMDGRAKAGGKSLNDAQLTGPKVINDLISVLLRFRREKICLICDIQDMYLRIRLTKEDKDFHRFLWRKSLKDEVIVYRLTRHPFGSSGSPYIAISTIKNHAEKKKNEYPRATEMIQKSSLVDDQLDSFESPEDAVSTLAQLRTIFNECDMTLSKILSNSTAVLKEVPTAETAKSLDIADKIIEGSEFPTVKALGIIYLPDQDVFSFSAHDQDKFGDILLQNKMEFWTKRRVAKHYSKLYDPLCFICPFIIQARIYFQSLWKMGFEWDEEIPLEHTKDWECWLHELKYLGTINIPRCLKALDSIESVNKQELHIFSDASQNAYGSVAYLRTIYNSGSIHIEFVAARCKLAPLHQHSIPRLEVLAAELAVKLKIIINESLGIQDGNIFFYTDSMNVLCWIQNNYKQLQAFVANRISKIQSNSSQRAWKYVNTKQNPADIASRGQKLRILAENRLWWKGPEFLTLPEHEWEPQPKITPTIDTLREVKKQGLIFITQPGTHKSVTDGYIRQDIYGGPHPEDISDLRRLINLERAGRMCLMRMLINTKRRLATGYNDLVLYFIRKAQEESLSGTLSQMKHYGHVSRNNSLALLTPFVDSQGLIRIGSRLRTSKHLADDIKYPILLPNDHPFSKLIVKNIHEQELNHIQGINHTLAALNKTYWIHRGKSTVCKWIGECIHCKKKCPKPMIQNEGPLPDFRIPDENERQQPFLITAIDCCGPFLTKAGRGRAAHKRYMLLFICTKIKAIHIEVLSDLSTDKLLLAFSRFLARRPRPKMFISDQGTNFKGAHQLLNDLWQSANLEEIQKRYPNITWKFLPPFSPNKGGLHERHIGIVKQALHKVISPGDISDEELCTAACIVEGILNSRPLCPIGDHGDLDALTPNHFLEGHAARDLIPLPKDISLRHRWFYIQELMDDFWKQYKREIIPALNNYHKKILPQSNLAEGDIVLLSPDIGRNDWSLGKVIRTYPNSIDGQTRVAEILSKGKMYTRSLNKIARLISDP